MNSLYLSLSLWINSNTFVLIHFVYLYLFICHRVDSPVWAQRLITKLSLAPDTEYGVPTVRRSSSAPLWPEWTRRPSTTVILPTVNPQWKVQRCRIATCDRDKRCGPETDSWRSANLTGWVTISGKERYRGIEIVFTASAVVAGVLTVRAASVKKDKPSCHSFSALPVSIPESFVACREENRYSGARS